MMTESEPGTAAATMRLNRFLARCGVASRRRSDALIAAGAVSLNGQVVAEPGVSVQPEVDRVEVEGQPVCLPVDFEYVILYKPLDCLVTRCDPRGRTTVFDVLPQLRPATVPVGRLDRNTTGLLLLTDDGALGFRLMHPSFRVDKVYEAIVDGRPDAAAVTALTQGVELDDGMTAPADVRVHESTPRYNHVDTRVVLTLHEGRKRQVRRMLRSVGHPVRRLHRMSLAGLRLDLKEPGSWRHLMPAEVARLGSVVGLDRGG